MRLNGAFARPINKDVERPLATDRLLAIIETQSDIVGAALDLDAVMALVTHRARALLGAAAAVVELVDGEEMTYHVGSGTAAEYAGLRIPIAGSLSGECVTHGELLHCEDASTDGRVDLDACRRVGAMSLVCVPLGHDGRTVGVLKVYDPRPRAFGPGDVETLRLLSAVIGAHMAHADDFEQQRRESRHDALTGMSNRRSFDERLGAEVARIRRYGGDLALCMLDLDGFKTVNDSFGHAAGDAVLRGVARNFARLRGEDEAFRVGGDEFAVLLVGATAEAARIVAERIAAAVDEDPACRGVGISFGIATLANGDPTEMIAAADAALYAAKGTVTR